MEFKENKEYIDVEVRQIMHDLRHRNATPAMATAMAKNLAHLWHMEVADYARNKLAWQMNGCPTAPPSPSKRKGAE